jgi:hypothetical protein
MSTKRNKEEKYMEKDKKKGIKKTIEEKEVGKKDFFFLKRKKRIIMKIR